MMWVGLFRKSLVIQCFFILSKIPTLICTRLDSNYMVSNISLDRVKGFFMGLAVGDALGIPVEFISRKKLAEDPVKNLRSGGTYEKPAGTWSVDGSLTFCVAESLLQGFDLQDIANKFVQFLYQNYWTADNEVFDV